MHFRSDHFLSIRSAAPTSSIRATAEYDAGAALIRLQNWTEAVAVLEAFRSDDPEHKLQVDATRQIANAYRESGKLSLAAGEYEGLASQSEDPALRSDALLVAGDLYEQSNARDRALDVYIRYVNEFPEPVETALETRNKIAEMYKAANEESRYHQELEQIVRIDADAGPERTGRTRTRPACPRATSTPSARSSRCPRAFLPQSSRASCRASSPHCRPLRPRGA